MLFSTIPYCEFKFWKFRLVNRSAPRYVSQRSLLAEKWPCSRSVDAGHAQCPPILILIQIDSFSHSRWGRRDFWECELPAFVFVVFIFVPPRVLCIAMRLFCPPRDSNGHLQGRDFVRPYMCISYLNLYLCVRFEKDQEREISNKRELQNNMLLHPLEVWVLQISAKTIIYFSEFHNSLIGLMIPPQPSSGDRASLRPPPTSALSPTAPTLTSKACCLRDHRRQISRPVSGLIRSYRYFNVNRAEWADGHPETGIYAQIQFPVKTPGEFLRPRNLSRPTS